MNVSSRFLSSAVALAAFSAAHAVVVTDLAANFDASNNPGLTNGWSYGFATMANASDFTLYDDNSIVTATYGAGTASGWSSTASPTGVYPYVAKNDSNWVYGGTVNFTAGTVIMHPGNASTHLFSVSRYTATSNLGLVQVDAFFQRLESAGSSSYGIYRNGVLLGGFGGTLTGSGAAFGPSNMTLLLNAGDSLDVVVGPGGDGFGGDVNLVSARISTVPGPAGAVGFAVGLLRRRRRRA